MVKIKSLEIDVGFSDYEMEFYNLNIEILHNMLEKVAINSSKRTMQHFKKIFPKRVFNTIIEKYNEELKKLE